jgi:hypothetical protein
VFDFVQRVRFKQLKFVDPPKLPIRHLSPACRLNDNFRQTEDVHCFAAESGLVV